MLSEEIKNLEQENDHLKEIIRSLRFAQEQRKEANLCVCCKHFYQHYIYSEGRYSPINCGHCGRCRVKHRQADATCEYFEYSAVRRRYF